MSTMQIFYFGYLAGSFLSGRGLQYFHAGKYIGANYFIWGCTLLGCVGAKSYGTLLALRFLLGTTMWYKQQEQSLRFGLWTVTNGIMPVPFLIIYWGQCDTIFSVMPPD
ncbi:hypothetical protein LTR41_006233 [Exophiala xenobiotica]|nr:hypothetical protein LTR41_006233 [Exophiala xenobiotica]